MGSMQIDCDGLDDSGCVQDDPVLQKTVMDPDEQVGLLDLSDDVLLYILRHCSPRDLKALGFSCARLGRLVRERSLWRQVDARSEQCSRARLCWHLQHTLHSDTRTLLLSGYAKVAAGCLGLANITRKEAEDEKQNYTRNAGPNDGDLVVYDVQHVRVPVFVERHRGRCFFNGQRSSHLARFRGSPTWPANVRDGRAGPADGCRGPQFTLSRALLRRLVASCGRLTHLALEYCNIDCHVTNLQQFPRTLTKLSLRGSKCFNMTIDKSFLFKIQDYLPVLASLDVSECEWMDPATLLPLSKLETLQELVMRDCPKLAEFVAYASLTSRYGFKSLKSLDLRGSPIGDSEASALGWLPKLERLWLSAARKRQPPRHLHYTDDERADHRELDDWEKEEPEYFKSKWIDDMEASEESTHRSVQSTSSAFSSSSTRSEDSTGDSQASSEYSPPKKRKRYNEVVIGQRTESIDARDGEKYIHTLEIKVTIDDDGEPREKGAGESADNKKGKTDKKENDSKEETEKGSPKKESPKKEIPGKDESPKKGETPKKEEKVKQVEASDAESGNPSDAGASTSKGAGTSKSDKTEGYVCFRQNRNPIYVNFKKTPTENDETETDDELDESNAEEPTDNQEKESKPSTSKESDKYVCFRKNRDPVYVNCSPETPRQNVNYQIEPRHHVLYVNFGPQPSTYRFARDDNEQLRLDFRSSHINPSSLVTDFAIRRFGRADGEDVNIFNLGHNEPGNNDGYNFRPDRSNLRFLSVTGYRNITDRSLEHLATSAPFLTEIDFTETSITERGAENFRSVRPDCELKYSQFVDRDEKKKKKDEECVTEFFL